MYQTYKMSILLSLFEVAVQISDSVSTLAKYKNSQKKWIVGRWIVKIKLLSIIQLNLLNQRRSAMFIENRPNVTFHQIMFQNVSKEIYFHIHIQIIIFGSAQFLISMFNWRGCEARLRKHGVKYDVTITSTNNIGIWKDGTWKKNYIKIQTMYLNASLKCLPTT